MVNPVDRDVLQELLAECEQKLEILTRARREALNEPLGRDVPLLRFLDKEQSVYAFGVALLTRLQQGGAPAQSAAAD